MTMESTCEPDDLEITDVSGSQVACVPGPPVPSDGDDASDGGGLDPLVLLIAVVLAALAAGIAGWLFGSRARPAAPATVTRAPRAEPPPVTPPPITPPPVSSGTPPPPPLPGESETPLVPELVTAEQRRRLVEMLIEVRDRIGPGATSDRIGQALSDVGVVTVDPTGTAFAVDEHQAVEAKVTRDPDLDGTVAETVRYGYTEAGRPLRIAEVIVWRLEASERG